MFAFVRLFMIGIQLESQEMLIKTLGSNHTTCPPPKLGMQL